MKTAIIIPARYASTRFPGKPLAKIGDKTMLERVVDIAKQASAKFKNITVCVATEDERIQKHCEEIDVRCVMTSDKCKTGSDRVYEASILLGEPLDFVVGLQGDAPFTPVEAPLKLIEEFMKDPTNEVVTPVVRLRWNELDALRESKKETPFSGTTCVADKNGRALWFSKNIIPAIRKEEDMKKNGEFSPVLQHIGLYGFRFDCLKKFVSLPEGTYEKLEGLEQLRLLENSIYVQTVELKVDAGLAQSGVDSPEDLKRAEKILKSL
jgi:3-deoxy-manno-octulosonate cytidylyltransferase (CMP-KDO synthetase)